ncbi:putative benzaldehyde dehydrogenase [Aromatoleum aromaticum EbN1]|uniref:Benzaldehyde dehydrogenase n=2 Tax=Aromatoleum aromaticum TaxID=551760 RepID=Q5P030_AROAE|nr:aldehyde dehydrogenase family protein [Aromatoleum aromaticum]CAI09334.1 putative benzaldehyde dehydrogenase [Aromatoleum aromaticum EbN1]
MGDEAMEERFVNRMSMGKGWIGGWTDLDGGVLAVTEPATGERLAEVGLASAGDVRRAAQLAAEAQPAWAAMPFLKRAAIFRRAAVILEREQQAVADWIVRETGGIRPKAEGEVAAVINHLHEAAAMLTQPRGLILPSDEGTLSYARRVPHGVVGVISPFNFPFLLSSRSLTPALGAGNAVVLKPDPRTPVSGGLLLALLFEAAGLPPNLLQVLPGEAEAGEAVVTDPDITMISFTGSTAVGRRVGELAGRHLKKVALELGGKNSLIVLDDADVDLAVSNGAFASWMHQGQICMSAGRHLVHEKVADAYVERMARKAKSLPVGDPYREAVALGPLITAKQLDRVERIVSESVRAGARLKAGGTARGQCYSPTVLDGVTPSMPAFREEIFGPVVSVTTFASDDEAVRLANDTEYGLSAGILTRSMTRGKAIAERLRVGLVHINDQTVIDDGFMPMGGRGASGNGSRHGGPANWDEFTQWQWVTYRDTPPEYPF